MSRVVFQRMTSGTAICAVLGAGLALPFGAWAQQNSDRGGMLSKLRLTERFIAREATSPDPTIDGTTLQLVTDLKYAFSTETRTEKLTFDAGGEYRFVNGPGTDGIDGQFTSPALRLRYDQQAANASLMVIATLAQDDLSDVSALSVSNTSGEVLPADLTALQDGGTRTELGFNSQLTLRDDAPFGIELGFLVNDVSYTGLPDGSGLSDGTTARADVTGRFDITPVLQTRAGLHYTYTDTDAGPQTDRYGMMASATLAQPNGAYTLSADRTDGDGGAITTLELGGRFELPRTKTNLTLGLAQATDDTVFVTGSAGLEHDFGTDSALGPLTLSADRGVTLTGRSQEELVTSLSLGGSYIISPVARVRLSAEMGQAETVATGDSVTLTEAALAFSYDFSSNWRGGADIRAKSRDPSDSAATDSTSFGISVTRQFEVRH